jgi:hypothetical protein
MGEGEGEGGKIEKREQICYRIWFFGAGYDD